MSIGKTPNRLYDQQILVKSNNLAKERSRKQLAKFFRFVVLSFLAIILLTILIQVPSVVNKIRKPFHSLQSNLANRGEINTKYRTNILLATIDNNSLRELGILSFENGDKKIKLVILNPKTKFDSLETQTDFSNLVLQNKELNIDRLEASLIESLGYFFDGYIVVEDKSSWINKPYIEKLIDNFYSFNFFWKLGSNKDYLDKSLHTSLTLDKANDLIWFSKSLTPERVSLIDLSKTIDQRGYLDGQGAVNQIGLQLSDNAIVQQETAVEIENGSTVPGVANTLKGVITNLGGTVLSVEKGEQAKKSQILYKQKDTILAKRLETIFKVKSEPAKKDQVIEGDLKLIIGEDFAIFFDF